MLVKIEPDENDKFPVLVDGRWYGEKSLDEIKRAIRDGVEVEEWTWDKPTNKGAKRT